ncbi:hypothetical protein Cgig2_028339 [Carnegiea gigantea]|uniref:DUF4283 domain-containing protein n=1 Tax=Carnegiea gigantea TaxID=171969 RepID=A0A9Q1QJV4_9CARY|nr:hypothetical protein Cgig2_028339 [Carnegiea gigantea]
MAIGSEIDERVPFINPSATLTPSPNQVIANSSYAAFVDPDMGNSLKYVLVTLINGVRCTHLSKEDVMAEIDHWQNAILCSVLGANPPFEVMQGFLKRIWTAYELDKIIHVRKGVFLIRIQMDNIVSWNIRGLNGPDKQKDVKIFLHTNKIRLVDLLETKNMSSAWCLIGDFNTILSKEGRIGGLEIKPQLRKLNRTHFYDLKEQQIRARYDLEEKQLAVQE